MSYYDGIADKWHEVTGYRGGAFKKLVLNEFLLSQITGVSGQSILELGAGNGYFMPMLLKRFSGQMPERIVITDISVRLLDIAHRHFRIDEARYRQLDVRREFPFDSDSFDLVLATMVFNEISDATIKKALRECRRIISETGILLFTATHPLFVENLHKRGQIKRNRNGLLNMPGANQLRLPIFRRKKDTYEKMLRSAEFAFEAYDLYAGWEVFASKPGLKHTGNIPLALVYRCRSGV